jgi:hypothetical protein
LVQAEECKQSNASHRQDGWQMEASAGGSRFFMQVISSTTGVLNCGKKRPLLRGLVSHMVMRLKRKKVQ